MSVGIKCSFIGEDGKFIHATFLGGDYHHKYNWDKELDKKILSQTISVINGGDVEEAINHAASYNRYIDDNGRVQGYDTLSIAYYRVKQGLTYKIFAEKSSNSAGWQLSYAENLDSNPVEPVKHAGKGTKDVFRYEYVAKGNGYIIVGYMADSAIPVVKELTQSEGLVKEVQQIKDNNRHIVDWRQKKWFVIGDSLSSKNSTTTKRYIEYIVEKTGIQANVRAVGGSSWGQPQKKGNAFYQQALEVPADTDIVTIFGSFNSWKTSDGDGPKDGKGTITDDGVNTYYGCVNQCFKNITSRAPLAKIGVIFPTPWSNQNPYTHNDTAETLISVIDTASKHWGIPSLDLFRGSGMRPWDLEYRRLVYSKDSGGIDGNPAGVHPNEIGHEIIASHVLAFMQRLLF